MDVKKYLYFFIFPVFLGVGAQALATDVKEPVVSGAFYPANAGRLKEKVDKFIAAAAPGSQVNGEIIAVITPHAGYDYSGWVAGYAYQAIKDKPCDTIIMVGPSHFYRFMGASVYPSGRFRTPLGDVPVDETASQRIMAYSQNLYYDPNAFKQEHSLEVQLPFLQESIKDFKIVPILIGTEDLDVLKTLSQAIIAAINAFPEKKFLLLASTDMSHYHGYKQASEMDQRTLEIMSCLDPESLYTVLLGGSAELCGSGAVVAVMLAAKGLGADKLTVLKYANSGDVTLDRARVVGYSSSVMIKSNQRADPAAPRNKVDAKKMMLNDQQRKRLLQIARQAINEHVLNQRTLVLNEEDAALKANKGAFVTITQNNELRGCIGHIVADTPLYQTIAEMAVAAAVSDPRFPALGRDELNTIHLEISVLSELKKVPGPEKIIVGEHGILLRKGFNSGLLLPQVATEYNWSRQEFLEHTCYKAGLDKDAWKKGAEIYVFSAEVFGEK